jgi:ribosomal-protein-alanine N-acetyltransferase
MEIRQVTHRELPRIAAIERELFSEPWSLQDFQEALENPCTIFLAAMEGDAVTAYGLLYCAADEGEIPTIATHPDYVRQGRGEAVLQAMIARGMQQGVEQIFLEVRQSNLPARHLYEKCGFQSVGVRKNFYRFPQEDALVLRLSIGT